MRHVLIPSNQGDVVHSLAEAYSRRGLGVSVGRANLELDLCPADVVHVMWPEEFTDWRVPRAEEIETIARHLQRWRQRARLILTVHNLYPHRHHGNALYHQLYSAFYQYAEVIHHTSETSRELVLKHFPDTAGRNHVVRLGYNYDRLLPHGPRDRAASRARFGFRPDEMVFLVLGTLRTWEEARLVRDALRIARIPGKRLLLCARLQQHGSRWQRGLRRWRWNYWARHSRRVTNLERFIPDEELHHLLDAADAVVVVRQNSLSSGVPSLGMTFGRLVICPDGGAMPEFVRGAANPLYEPFSARSLAAAMERAATLDRAAIGARNRAIAAGWDWEGIAQTCLDALPRKPISAPATG